MRDSTDSLKSIIKALVESEQRYETYAAHPSEDVLKRYLMRNLPQGWRPSREIFEALNRGERTDWHQAEVGVHVKTCSYCWKRVLQMRNEQLQKPRLHLPNIWERLAKLGRRLLEKVRQRRPTYPFTDAEVLAFFNKPENRERIRVYGFRFFGRPIDLENLSPEEQKMLYEMIVKEMSKEKKSESEKEEANEADNVDQ